MVGFLTWCMLLCSVGQLLSCAQRPTTPRDNYKDPFPEDWVGRVIGPVASGVSVEGRIVAPKTADIYSFGASSSRTEYQFRVESTSGLDPQVFVYDKKADILNPIHDDNSGGGVNSHVQASLRGRWQGEDDFAVIVASADGSVGTYILTVDYVPFGWP